jgi:hypothetical protein
MNGRSAACAIFAPFGNTDAETTPVIKKLKIVVLFVALCHTCYGQDSAYAVTQGNPEQEVENRQNSKKRVALVTAGNILLWGSSYYALNKAWYADFPRTSFHFFNDNAEWQQMDKLGHLWTSYQVSRLSAEMWKWTGIDEKSSIIIGGISGTGYLTLVEILDGYSSQWGFSWGDMAANAAGSAAFVSQELLWKEQRISVKFSYWPYDYSGELERRNQMFGKSLRERILKDYNGQAYWASVNLKSFARNSSLPGWFNIAVGYSADGMLGGKTNIWTDRSGFYHDRRDIQRIRRFYLSPDIDFTKIRTEKKLLRSLFFVLNAVKFPAPALELNSKGGVAFRPLAF